MYSYFTDLHVDLLAQALLQPGERRLGETVGRHVPWWALGLVNETYLLLATDQRLILVEHRMAWLHQAMKVQSVWSIPWSAVQEARLKGIFTKKLVIRGQADNQVLARTLRIPAPLFGLLAPIRQNVAGARAVAGAFDAARGLAAAPAYAALPPQVAPPRAPSQAPSPYAQVASYDQTQPPTPYGAFYGQAQAPAALPPFNAPGYASVPPMPAQPPAAVAAPPYADPYAPPPTARPPMRGHT